MTEERIKQLAMGKWEADNDAPGWEEICELANLAGVGLAAQKRVRELEERIKDLEKEVRQAAIDSAFHATHPLGDGQ